MTDTDIWTALLPVKLTAAFVHGRSMAKGVDLEPPSPTPDLRAMSDDEAITAMVAWFFDNFEDPAEMTPWDEGEYVFIWGGPYDAREELEEAFGQVSEALISAAADRIAEDGWEWAPSSARLKDEADE